MVFSQTRMEEDGTVDLSPSWIPNGYVGTMHIVDVILKPNKSLELWLNCDVDKVLYKAQLPMWSNEIKEIARVYGAVVASWKGQPLAVGTTTISWKGVDKVVRKLKPIYD